MKFQAMLPSKASEQPVLQNIEFVAFGDLQYDSSEVVRGTPLQYAIRDSVRHAVDNNPNIQYLLHVGDYMNLRVNQSTAQYAPMNASMQYYTGKQYACLGNHDVGYTTGIDAQIIADYFNYAHWDQLGNLQTKGFGFGLIKDSTYLLLINSCEAGSTGLAAGTTGTGTGNITSTQIQFIKDALDSIVISNARLIVMTHHSLGADELPELSPGVPNVGYQMEETIALEIQHLLAEWQAKSDKGLVLTIFNGHSHINTRKAYNQYFGKLDNFTLNDSEAEQGWGGFTGTDVIISTNPAYFQYSIINFNETTKTLTITGIGQNDSYSVNMSDRITSPQAPSTSTELPICGVLSVTNPSFRLSYLTVSATHSIGVVGYEVWLKTTGGDTADVPLQLYKKVYQQNLVDSVLGRLTSGGSIEMYVIAFDEVGNKSVKSNTVIFTSV